MVLWWFSVSENNGILDMHNHVCLVVPQGRVYLLALYVFSSSFPTTGSHFTKHHSGKLVMQDIEWWILTLSQKWCGIKIRLPPPPMDTKLFVDALTTWGSGLVMDSKWLAWPLKDDWKLEGRDIGWAEMVTVNLVVWALVNAGLINCHIVLCSDNSGVVGALSSGYSRSLQQNFILWHIVNLFQTHEIWITIKWVPSKINLADGQSRGLFPLKAELLSWPPAVPVYLKHFVWHAICHDELHWVLFSGQHGPSLLH